MQGLDLRLRLEAVCCVKGKRLVDYAGAAEPALPGWPSSNGREGARLQEASESEMQK
jgi:hypothetical protein